jgi:HEAT repeat protein
MHEREFIQSLTDRDAAVRLKAITELRQHGELAPSILEKVSGLLTDRNESVRQAAAQLMDEAGAAAVAPLSRIIVGSSEAECLAALSVVAGLGERATGVLPALEKASRDKSPRVRSAAATAIGRYGDRIGVAHLRRLLLDSDATVKVEAAWGLAHMGPIARDASGDLAKVMKDNLAKGDDELAIASAARVALLCIGPEAANSLLDLVKENTNARTIRLEALRILGDMSLKPDSASPTLVAMLSDRDEKVREMTAYVLKRFGRVAKSALPALAVALMDNDTIVRVRSAGAIYAINPHDNQCIDVLIACLSSSDARARSQACLELGEIGKDAARSIPAIVKCLKDVNSQVRHSSVDCLMKMGPVAAAAEPALLEMEDDQDSSVRSAVRSALREIRQKKPPR